jgi:hypothetical protein
VPTQRGISTNAQIFFALLVPLYLNSSANLAELKEFGWFETNSAGNVIGTKHVLFHGSGVPPGTAVPDAVGATVSFMPTQYFGYY